MPEVIGKVAANANRAAFLSALATERNAFAEFVGILEAEHTVLLDGNIDALLALAQSKANKIAELSQLAEHRLAHLRAEGFSADRTGMSQWLIAHAGNSYDTLSKQWNALIEDAARAQQLNETNGALIEAKLRFNQAALTALQAAAKQNSVYGPDGTTSVKLLGRDFGKA